jgi:hypothetical protein
MTLQPTKEIVFDRETRDYAMYYEGQLIGWARSYSDAEVILNAYVYELLTHTQTETADIVAEVAASVEADAPILCCPACGEVLDCENTPDEVLWSCPRGCDVWVWWLATEAAALVMRLKVARANRDRGRAGRLWRALRRAEARERRRATVEVAQPAPTPAPSVEAQAAYVEAKATGASDTDAWWAAYNAAPSEQHAIAHYDATAAQSAYAPAPITPPVRPIALPTGTTELDDRTLEHAYTLALAADTFQSSRWQNAFRRAFDRLHELLVIDITADGALMWHADREGSGTYQPTPAACVCEAALNGQPCRHRAAAIIVSYYTEADAFFAERSAAMIVAAASRPVAQLA